MSEVHDKLSGQLLEFLDTYEIVTFDTNDEMYHWTFDKVEYKLGKDMVTRFANTIAGEWIEQHQTTDIMDFNEELKMSIPEIVTMVRNLVKQDLGKELGVV